MTEAARPIRSMRFAGATRPDLVASVDGAPVFVRVNAVAGVVLAKTESGGDVERARGALAAASPSQGPDSGHSDGVVAPAVLAGIESARGVADVDGIFAAAPELCCFDAEARRAIGYRAKLCIHPSHVPIANRAFGATVAEAETARALLAAWEEGAARGVAAVEFEGSMIDGPARRMARGTIARGGEA